MPRFATALSGQHLLVGHFSFSSLQLYTPPSLVRQHGAHFSKMVVYLRSFSLIERTLWVRGGGEGMRGRLPTSFFFWGCCYSVRSMVVTMKQMNTVFVFLLAVRSPSPKPIPKANADVNGCPLPILQPSGAQPEATPVAHLLHLFVHRPPARWKWSYTIEIRCGGCNKGYPITAIIGYCDFGVLCTPLHHPACSCQDVADPEALPSGASSPQKPFRFLPGPSREVLSVINHIGATCFNGWRESIHRHLALACDSCAGSTQ